MVYCNHCMKNVAGMRPEDGSLCCNFCGKVLEDYNFSTEATFFKNAAGQSQMSGNYVRTVQSEFSASRQRTLDKAYEEISYINSALGVGDDHLSSQALAFYRIALERNFTKGRRAEQVQAACLYIAFRENNKPYLLIDFSNYLRTNVYVLGAVFLQLCKVLRLEEHPIVQKPVDPSLFITKYTNNLLKERNMDVTKTALSIIASMKRDWMQTGRKPSGLCGAALYISALAHGFKCSKSDILRLVHVCEATLTKRLVEFENTESASLTIEELNAMAKEHEKSSIGKPQAASEESELKDLLCEHKGSGIPHFALGLCGSCYNEFIKLSGGLDGGVDPPAFQRAEKERLAKSLAEDAAAESTEVAKASDGSCRDKNEEIPAPHGVGANSEHFPSDYDNDTNFKDPGESESLSDIDDLEVDAYLHNEEEKHYKKIIWEEMNREYLEEQAAKEAAAAAAKEAFEANFRNCPEDLKKAKELAAATAEAVAKIRKEKQRERLRDAKNAPPAQTPAEATQQMLKKKRLSNKVNYDVLEKLFEESGTKKMRNGSKSDNDGIHESKKPEKESLNDNDESELADFAEEGDQGDYGTVLYDDNGDVIDYNNDDYGYDGY